MHVALAKEYDCRYAAADPACRRVDEELGLLVTLIDESFAIFSAVEEQWAAERQAEPIRPAGVVLSEIGISVKDFVKDRAVAAVTEGRGRHSVVALVAPLQAWDKDPCHLRDHQARRALE